VAGPQVERSTHLTLFRRKHPARWFSRGGPLPPVLLAVFVLGAVPAFAGGEARAEFPVPRLPYAPRGYVAPRALEAPQIDGRPDDAAWQEAAWTEDFVDIEGPLRPAPRFRTRAKMLWDDRYFYVLAEMEEPDLWATYDRRDAIIFHEHDFEIFLDPDGDTHEYYELEINARNNVWDLLLVRPYRDGGPAVHAWDIAGLRTAVRLDGTLNDPTDRDRGWHAEIALPWEILKECAHRPAPPAGGDRWRLNFSRVEWRLEPAADGDGYRKVLGADGKPLPEDNWVWSPQGTIDMHRPETWGYVQFSDAEVGTEAFRPDPTYAGRVVLQRIYYAQKAYHQAHGEWARSLDALGLAYLTHEAVAVGPTMELDALDGWFATVTVGHDGGETKLRIRADAFLTAAPAR